MAFLDLALDLVLQLLHYQAMDGLLVEPVFATFLLFVLLAASLLPFQRWILAFLDLIALNLLL